MLLSGRSHFWPFRNESYKNAPVSFNNIYFFFVPLFILMKNSRTAERIFKKCNCGEIFIKWFCNFELWLKSDKNNGHFTWRPACFHTHYHECDASVFIGGEKQLGKINTQKFRVLSTIHLCVLCGCQNKQRLFPYTALTYRFLKPKQRVFTARYEMGL